MQNDFQCIKIKDGLYLGNLQAAQDYEFLVINKFAYIINCSAEMPNHYESMGIKYLKFKLLRQKQHKLFNQSLKKLSKIQNFIAECEQNSMCCLITSQQNNTRSLVMITAFLMGRFKWTLRKTLQYIRSKGIYILLNDHYLNQLEILQEILKKNQANNKLNQGWKGPYICEQEQIISKTYINSQQITTNQDQSIEAKPKKAKRIVWLDIEKQQKKIPKKSKSKQLKQKNNKQDKTQSGFQKTYQAQQKAYQKQIDNKQSEVENGKIKINKLLRNNFLQHQQSENKNESLCFLNVKKKKQKQQKIGTKSISLNKISVHSDKTNSLSEPKLQKLNTQQDKCQTAQYKQEKQKKKQIIDQRDLMKLIKQNLKLSKLTHIQGQKNDNQYVIERKQQQNDKLNSNGIKVAQQNTNLLTNDSNTNSNQLVYNLTINNFIHPNIQLLNQNNNSKKLEANGEKIKKKNYETKNINCNLQPNNKMKVCKKNNVKSKSKEGKISNQNMNKFGIKENIKK